MSLTAHLHCEIREVGSHWWPVATFEIGSARHFRQAIQGQGSQTGACPPTFPTCYATGMTNR